MIRNGCDSYSESFFFHRLCILLRSRRVSAMVTSLRARLSRSSTFSNFPVFEVPGIKSVICTRTGDDRPNFLFFLVDDLGWADVGYNGSTFYETPHIDALATSGTRFTNGYAAASICSPTRASILTGRHPVRVNITDYIPGLSNTGKFKKVEDRDNLERLILRSL